MTAIVRYGLVVLFLAAGAFASSGCSTDELVADEPTTPDVSTPDEVPYCSAPGIAAAAAKGRGVGARPALEPEPSAALEPRLDATLAGEVAAGWFAAADQRSTASSLAARTTAVMCSVGSPVEASSHQPK